MASISQSTLKQYISGLKLWWEFCASKNADPYLVSAVQVLDFLTLQFNKGASYSSLNIYRSSLAQMAPDLSHDFRIHKFFKDQLCQDTRNFKNSDISLNILSKKLITLLALATGQRIQTLASIEIDNIHRSDMKIDIPIPRRTKTSARNKFQPFLILPFFGLKFQLRLLVVGLKIFWKKVVSILTNFPHIVPDMLQHQPRSGKVLISTRLDFQQAAASLKIRKCSLRCIFDPLCQIYHLQKRFE
nr:unnamed protein product [Callosobruchus chinensis]